MTTSSSEPTTPAGRTADTTEVPATTEVDTTDDTEPQDDSTEDDQDGGDGRRRNREPALRHRAQAAEAERDAARGERDALRTQLDALQGGIVAEVATGRGLPDVALLWAAGNELAGFVNEDGTVNFPKVVEAADDAIRRFHIGVPLRPNAQQGAQGGMPRGSHLADTIGKALGR